MLVYSIVFKNLFCLLDVYYVKPTANKPEMQNFNH